jgi:hypothetical protein
MYANVHRNPDTPPWLPEDFMGRGDRQQRLLEARKTQREVARANLQLAKLSPGSPAPAGFAQKLRVN